MTLDGVRKSKKSLTNYAIQKTQIICSEYFIGTQFSKEYPNRSDVNQNSIYGVTLDGPCNDNSVTFNYNELLKETSRLGKTLYQMYEDTIKSEKEKIIFSSYPNTFVKETQNKNIIETCSSAILDWCKIYGFPIPVKPIPVKPISVIPFYDEIGGPTVYELTSTSILEISEQFINIYLLNSFYDDTMELLRMNPYPTDWSEKNWTLIRRFEKRLNLWHISGLNLDEDCDVIYTDYVRKTVLKKIIPILNDYSQNFCHYTEKHFSYLNGNIYCQIVYENIFDICFDLIASKFTNYSLQTSTKKCVDCGVEIPVITDKKRCDKCNKNNTPAQKTHEKKRGLIEKILKLARENYDLQGALNPKYLDTIDKYSKIIQKSKSSQALINLKVHDLNDFLHDLNIEFANLRAKL